MQAKNQLLFWKLGLKVETQNSTGKDISGGNFSELGCTAELFHGILDVRCDSKDFNEAHFRGSSSELSDRAESEHTTAE